MSNLSINVSRLLKLLTDADQDLLLMNGVLFTNYARLTFFADVILAEIGTVNIIYLVCVEQSRSISCTDFLNAAAMNEFTKYFQNEKSKIQIQFDISA